MLLFPTLFALLIYNAATDTIRICSTIGECGSETGKPQDFQIDCDPICVISCTEYLACNAMTINVPIDGSLTFTSTNYSHNVIINAAAAALVNISCIGDLSCSIFDVVAAGKVYIEARGINAIFTDNYRIYKHIYSKSWDVSNASSASITCASYASDDDNACNAAFVLPDKWDNPSAAIALYCYGDGCSSIELNVENGLNENTRIHFNGCGGKTYESADDCVSSANVLCAFITGCSSYASRGGETNDALSSARCEDNDVDYFYGDECNANNCGCHNLLPVTFINEEDDKCVYGDDGDGDRPGFAFEIGGSGFIAYFVLLLVGAIFISICCVFCRSCGSNKARSKYIQPSGGITGEQPVVAQSQGQQPQQVVMMQPQQQQQVMMVQPQQVMMQQPQPQQQVQYVQNVPQQQVQYYPQQQTVSQPLQGAGAQEGGITHQ